jgi:hypothetical protein
MRKKIILIILTVCMALNMITVSAEQSGGEIPEAHNKITLCSEYDDVYVGEKVKITAAITSVDADTCVKAIWNVNGKTVPESSGVIYVLQEGIQMDFNYVVPPFEEVTEMSVTLSLYDLEDNIVSTADKKFAVKKEIPVSILSSTKIQKVYADQKFTASVQLKNTTGRVFEYKAYWVLNEKKVGGYEIEDLVLEEKSDYTCPINLSGFAGKKVKVTFFLENGITSTSLDMDIEVLRYSPEVIYKQKVEEMKKTIKTVEIECILVRDSNVYKDLSLKKKVAFKGKGVKGIYINYNDTKSAKVRFSDGTIGWVPYWNISISKTNYTDTKGCSDELKEIFANENGYKSDTDYLIWISLKFQQVNVFNGKMKEWKLEKSMTCATGKNTTPTISGVFKYFQFQDRWNFGKYYVAPIMRFNGGTALHSRTYKPNGGLLDPTLGKPASHGCVRMKQEDIDWLVENIPLKTSVVVF